MITIISLKLIILIGSKELYDQRTSVSVDLSAGHFYSMLNNMFITPTPSDYI